MSFCAIIGPESGYAGSFSIRRENTMDFRSRPES